MAVLVEGISVIVRRETIARRYDGGWPGFVADAFNSTLCADSDLARVGFMRPDDVRAFIRRLDGHGFVFLRADGTAVDIVVIDQREGPTTPCAWIEFFRQNVPGGAVSAARLAGSQEKSLVCPDGWEFEQSLSHRHEFHSGNGPHEDLEFLRHEHGTDVYRNRKTGQDAFVSRPSALEDGDQKQSGVEDVAPRQEQESLWAEAGHLLQPYIGPEHRPANAEEAAQIARARDILERLTSLSDVSWRPWWLLGVARRNLRDRQGAYAAFSHAYGMAADEIEVGRCLAMECIALGYAPEAIAVTAAMVRLAPGDAGLIANHALALLIGAEVECALHEIRRAEQIDSRDEITLNLRGLIEAVRDGKVKAPSQIET